MNKLTDKQMNLAIVGAGVLVAIIFFTMRHFDQNEIARLAAEKQNVDTQIVQLKGKERQMEAKKQELYLMRANNDAVKRLLPQDKKVTEFFELMEQFRLQNEIQAFNKVNKVDEYFEINDEKEEDAPQVPAVLPPRVPRAAPSAANPFVEDGYHVEFKGSFNDLGELISKIESHERFFSIKEIKLDHNNGNLDVDLENKVMRGKVQLVVTTFTFENPDPTIDEKLTKILEGYEPSTLLKQKVRERREELLKRYVFQWSELELIDDPFYPFRAIKIIVPTKVDVPQGGVGPDDVTVLTSEKIQAMYTEVNTLYNETLKPLSLEGDWVKLEETLKEKDMLEQLRKLNLLTFPADFDPDGQKRDKLNKIQAEIKVWQTYIEDIAQKEALQRLIDKISDKVSEVAKLYKQARKKGDAPELLNQVVAKHNDIMPELLKHKDKEEQYKVLGTARKKLEFYYKKAKIQLELIERVKKLELTGVIYQPDKKKPSVAFINKKPVRRQNTLKEGFVVKEINNGWVVLDYKGETVPLRMKSLAAA